MVCPGKAASLRRSCGLYSVRFCFRGLKAHAGNRGNFLKRLSLRNLRCQKAGRTTRSAPWGRGEQPWKLLPSTAQRGIELHKADGFLLARGDEPDLCLVVSGIVGQHLKVAGGSGL